MFMRSCLGIVALSIGALAQAQNTYNVASSLIATDNPSMIKDVKRVAITQFVVQFFDKQNDMATSAGLRGGASATIEAAVVGPTPDQYQRITDQLYDEAVKAMQTAGIEVIAHEKLSAHPEYAKLVESGKPSPQQDEKFIGYGGWTYSTKGLPITFDSDDEESFMVSSRDKDPRGDHYRSMGSMLGGNSTSTRWAEWNLAKGLNTHLLKVRVTIPMAFVAATGGFLSGSTNTKVAAAPRLARDVTRFTFRRERSAARVRLDQHLMLPTDFIFLETVSKQVDNTGGLAAAFGMRGSAQAAYVYRLNVLPAKYETEVLGAARGTFQTFGQVLQSTRQGN
jgi:hypothetical protein